METTLKAKGVTFTVFMVPCQILCPVTPIATAGIAANAFATPFKSLAEILERPILEDTDCVPLHWKDDILDKVIFPMKYWRLRKIWKRLWQVSGSQECLRL